MGRGLGEMLLDLTFQYRLGNCSDHRVHMIPIPKEQHARDGADIEPHGRALIGVDVEFPFALIRKKGAKKWIWSASKKKMTENGDLAALRLRDGGVIWRKNILKEFGSNNPHWLISESPLIDGNRLVVSPGPGRPENAGVSIELMRLGR